MNNEKKIDPSEVDVMVEFMNFLENNPEITPEDLGVKVEEERTAFGMMRVFSIDSILKSNYHEFISSGMPRGGIS